MIVLRQREVRNVVDVQVVAEGFQQLNAVPAERADLRYLIANVAVDPNRRDGLDRHDLVTVERRRDLVSEEIGAAALGGDAEAEARDALLGGFRLGIEFAPGADVAAFLHDYDGVRHGEDEAADVQRLARVRALVLRLYVRTCQRARSIGGHGRAFRGDVSPIEAPVDFRYRDTDRRAGEDQHVARHEDDHRRWRFYDVNGSCKNKSDVDIVNNCNSQR